MNKCDKLREMLMSWAETYYLPLLHERNRYREIAHKYVVKNRELEKKVDILEFKLCQAKKASGEVQSE